MSEKDPQFIGYIPAMKQDAPRMATGTLLPLDMLTGIDADSLIMLAQDLNDLLSPTYKIAYVCHDGNDYLFVEWPKPQGQITRDPPEFPHGEFDDGAHWRGNE